MNFNFKIYNILSYKNYYVYELKNIYMIIL